MKAIIETILCWTISFVLIFLSFDIMRAIKKEEITEEIYQLNDYVYSEELSDRTAYMTVCIEEFLEVLPENIKNHIINKYEIIMHYAPAADYIACVSPVDGIMYINLYYEELNYPEAFEAVFYHEVGHVFQFKTIAFDEELFNKYDADNSLLGEYFDSDYTHSNIKEFYATAFSIYITDPEYLQENYEDIYEYIDEKVLNFPCF